MAVDRETIRRIRRESLLSGEDIEHLFNSIGSDDWYSYPFHNSAQRARWLADCISTADDECAHPALSPSETKKEPSSLPAVLAHSNTEVASKRQAVSALAEKVQFDYESGKRRLGLSAANASIDGIKLLRVQEQPTAALNVDQLSFLRNTLSEAQNGAKAIGLAGLARFIEIKSIYFTNSDPRSYSKAASVSYVDHVVTSFALASGDLAIDVRVTSTPVQGAQVTLRTATGHIEVDTNTDSPVFHNVYRGIYLYEVKKDGWKTGQDREVNLVDSPSGSIACTLQPPTSTLATLCGANE